MEVRVLTCCVGAFLLPFSSRPFMDAVAPAAASAGGASVAEGIAAGSADLAEAGRVLARASLARLAVTRICRFRVEGLRSGVWGLILGSRFWVEYWVLRLLEFSERDKIMGF